MLGKVIFMSNKRRMFEVDYLWDPALSDGFLIVWLFSFFCLRMGLGRGKLAADNGAIPGIHG
jgi:hypothetical protein